MQQVDGHCLISFCFGRSACCKGIKASGLVNQTSAAVVIVLALCYSSVLARACARKQTPAMLLIASQATLLPFLPGCANKQDIPTLGITPDEQFPEYADYPCLCCRQTTGLMIQKLSMLVT